MNFLALKNLGESRHDSMRYPSLTKHVPSEVEGRAREDFPHDASASIVLYKLYHKHRVDSRNTIVSRA